jgi:hypothetical protein
MPFVKLVKNKAYFKRFQTKYRRRRGTCVACCVACSIAEAAWLSIKPSFLTVSKA